MWKLICKIFWHKDICLGRYNIYTFDNNTYPRSCISYWKCSRCKRTKTEQWDT